MHEANAPEVLFRQHLRGLRQRRGWSQAELAKRAAGHLAGLDQSKIALIESGKRVLRLSEAVALAATLGSAVNLMLLEQPASLEDQIAETEHEVAELNIILMNTSMALEQATERLGRLQEQLAASEPAETPEAGAWDGDQDERSASA